MYRFSFFFQAEDGIRDSSVTGVQTCALPISMHNRSVGRPASFTSSTLRRLCMASTRGFTSLKSLLLTTYSRSGERRVGEEGRSRWAPDHLKKKKKKVEHTDMRRRVTKT